MLATLSGYYRIANFLDWHINPVFSVIHSLINSLATYNLSLCYSLSDCGKNISMYLCIKTQQ